MQSGLLAIQFGNGPTPDRARQKTNGSMIILKPSTLNTHLKRTMDCWITVYPQNIRISKDAAIMLNVPKNKISIELSGEKMLIRIDDDGFAVQGKFRHGFTINSRPLCKIIIKSLDRKPPITFELKSTSVPDVYELKVLK